jgi:regulator of replication initiation timing
MNIFQQVFATIPVHERVTPIPESKYSSLRLPEPPKTDSIRMAVAASDAAEKASSFSRTRQTQRLPDSKSGRRQKDAESIDYQAEIDIIESKLSQLQAEVKESEQSLLTVTESNAALTAGNQDLERRIRDLETEANNQRKKFAEARASFEEEDKQRNHFWQGKFLEVQFELDELKCSRAE